MCQVNSCNELFSCFKIFGKFFITVDDDLNEDVLKLYANYISKLESTLTNENITLKPAKLPDSDEINKQEDQHSLEEYLDELNKLVGLEKVKKDVNSLINLVRIRKLRSERGIKQPPMSLHLVFSGNPGTGKTTVARLLSKIYCEIGLLSKGHLVETDRSGLVGGFVGQTAIKTQEVIQSALGGILFIDEAYSLTSKSENDYGAEAIDTLLKAMEDYRDDLIVIVAGYPALMDKFLYSNPGLESRFNKFIYFEDYNEEELYNIFQLMSKESNLTIDEAGDNYLKEYFKKVYENRSSNFANGRAVRNLFEEVITNQANRLANKSEITDDELNTLTYEDFLVDENE
ncbi:AAA family ATPase [Methanobrevibacter gottschalkii]|uniref:AAA family ATPase n=1 Tax=Methanobrevibacter gottschalkii TaxID=190974 RepID=UPI0026F35E8A|nr:AAA family ATPase [Methanobrevibacter gottschalkii]